MYYLQSRYYNPEWGRFLNADTFVSTGQGILGNNMFAYCRNNPVKRIDVSGWYDLDCVSVDSADDELVREEAYLGGGTTTSDARSGGCKSIPGNNPCDPVAEIVENVGSTSGTGRAPSQGAPGTTYTQYSSDGKNTVVSQTTYGEYGAPALRMDYQGHDHHKGLPHLHVFLWGMRNGKVCPIKPEQIYSFTRN